MATVTSSAIVLHEGEIAKLKKDEETHRRMFLTLEIGDGIHTISTLVDTGAELNVCNEQTANFLRKHTKTMTSDTHLRVRGVNGVTQTASKIVSADFYITVGSNPTSTRKRISVDFHVLNTQCCVLGAGALCKYNLGMQFQNEGSYMWVGSNKSKKLKHASILSISAPPKPEHHILVWEPN